MSVWFHVTGQNITNHAAAPGHQGMRGGTLGIKLSECSFIEKAERRNTEGN